MSDSMSAPASPEAVARLATLRAHLHDTIADEDDVIGHHYAIALEAIEIGERLAGVRVEDAGAACSECGGKSIAEYHVCRDCWMNMHGSEQPLPTNAELIDFGEKCVRGYLDFAAARDWFLNAERSRMSPPRAAAGPDKED